jgi:uncharacterized protein
MEIQVKDLLSKGMKVPIRRSLDAEWLRQVRKDVIGTSPLEVDLTASGEDGVAHVEGELSIEVELACSRCLEPTKARIAVPFHERFKPAAAMNGGSEEEEIIPVEDGKIDLEPLIEETVMLSLPFVPLCVDDCKGLCHTCGANLNEQNCGCSKDRIDPRMAALKDLFK